jgi:hypothetical protein
MRILIVSNDSRRGDALAKLLEGLGAEVNAIYRTKFFDPDLNDRPDLIIADGHCKEMDWDITESRSVPFDEPREAAKKHGVPYVSVVLAEWLLSLLAELTPANA